MSIEQLVGTYAQLRHELELALASKAWKSRRQRHIRRLSRELGHVEEQLQQKSVSDDLFVALVSGTYGLEQVLIAPQGQRLIGFKRNGMRP